MAYEKRAFWLVLRVWHVSSICLHCQHSICAAEHVLGQQKASVHHSSNKSAGLYLETSNDVTIRVGKLLQLNCSIIGAANSSQLSWYRGNQSLSNHTTKLSNETIQLIIEQVDWINNGSYVCKEKGKNNIVQPKSVAVTIGDIPSPPRDVWVNNVEYKTRIHWKAPLYSGGLKLKYAVKARCAFNTSSLSADQLWECKKDFFTICSDSHFQQEPGAGSDSFFCDVFEVLSYHPHSAYVEAINDLGTGVSNPVEFTQNIMFDPLLTTPSPTAFLDAREVAPPVTVKLSWKDSGKFKNPALLVKYTIMYHREGDSYNKSKTIDSRTKTLITDLVGLSWYYFYLMVRYGRKSFDDNTTSYGIDSEAVERKFRTKISAPKPPVISNCSSWSNLNSKPALTVTWVVPKAEYFNGPLRNAVVLYRCQRGNQLISGNITTNNGSTHSVVIPALKPSDRCNVQMKLCNEPGQLCSVVSGICRTGGDTEVSSVPPYKVSKKNLAKTILIAVAGAVGGIFLVFVVFMCYRNRPRGSRRPSLGAVLDMPPIHGYDEIEESLDDENYDRLELN